MDEQLKQSALDFHEFPVPGKIQVSPTKPLATQRDLRCYAGSAAPCLEIEKDPLAAYKYTARGNLVAVISNGTAVLGLGNIGALAGKPVMEGKGVLFKKFAGIDVFDIEVDELDPDKFINVVAALEPTFGGINLEDIKAPECFYIEQKLRERMNIPVFHDDQHGTAIISTAAILNGLRVVGKTSPTCAWWSPARVRGHRLYDCCGARHAEAQHCGLRLQGRDLQRPRAKHGGNQSGLRG